MNASTSSVVIFCPSVLAQNILATPFTKILSKNDTGVRTNRRTLYIGATVSDIGPANREQMVFGVISPNMRSMSVTKPVTRASHVSPEYPSFSAIVSAETVARADAPTFTRLFPMRIVMRSLSVSDLILSRDFAQNLFSLLYHSIACFESVMRAISVPEKKAERATSTTNSNI